MIEENEKKVFSQTHILYVVKATFLSELEQYVNIFLNLQYSVKKAIKFRRISQKTIKKFFWLKNNYAGETEFSLALRKLEGSLAKLFSREFSVEFSIKP